MKRAIRAHLAGIAFFAVSGLLSNTMHGQQPGAEKVKQLVSRVPPAERFTFSQQLLNGVVRGLDPEKEADLKTLNDVADRWTDWVCHSAIAGAESEEWSSFVQTANAAAVRQYKMSLVVDGVNYPRLTALALPIDLDGVRDLEHTYAAWTNDRNNLKSWAEMQSLLGDVAGKQTLPGTMEAFAIRLDNLYSNPTPHKWNELIQSAGDLKWSREVFANAQQKLQVDRGVQRVLLASNWDDPGDRHRAMELGRDYWRSSASNEPERWSKLFDSLMQLLSDKRLETIVTFATRNSKGATKDATIAYRYTAGNKAVRTIQMTVKINSGEYEVWSERKDKETSSKMTHRIFSETFQVPILERDDGTP